MFMNQAQFSYRKTKYALMRDCNANARRGSHDLHLPSDQNQDTLQTYSLVLPPESHSWVPASVPGVRAQNLDTLCSQLNGDGA